MTVGAPLVLAAHGSADPQFDAVVRALATIVVGQRPDLDVRVGYLDHGPPDLTSVSRAGAVIVPLLLTRGFHVSTDIPHQAPGCVVTSSVGPDPRVTAVLVSRLRDAGWSGQQPVVLAAAGSKDPTSLADVHRTAGRLGEALNVDVRAAFLSAGEPRFADLEAAAVATYLLAPGYFADLVAAGGAAIVGAPLGADPVLAQIIIDRYDTATGASIGAASTIFVAEPVE